MTNKDMTNEICKKEKKMNFGIVLKIKNLQ